MPESSDSNNTNNDSDDNTNRNTSDVSLNNVKLSELYKGSSSYYPWQPFDDCLLKFDGTQKEKMALAKKNEKRKNGIKEGLCRFFRGKKMSR